MTNSQDWYARMRAVIGRSESAQVRSIRAAHQAIIKSFGARHQIAAQNCITVLETLLVIARRRKSEGVIGLTQKEIASHTEWTESTIGKHTRYMEKLGLLRIDRTTKCRGGRRIPNNYYFVFLEDVPKPVIIVDIIDQERPQHENRTFDSSIKNLSGP